MKTFKQYITEMAPFGEKQAIDHVFKGKLPLSSKMIDRLFGKETETILHVTNIEGFEQLIKLQGKKSKHVAGSSFMSADNAETGVGGKGGIVVEIEGKVLASFKKDIVSTPDKDGNRWISVGALERTPFTSKLFDDLDKLKNLLLKKVEPMLIKTPQYEKIIRLSKRKSGKEHINAPGALQSHLRTINDKIYNKAKFIIISNYYDEVEKIIKKNKIQFRKLLFSATKDPKDVGQGYSGAKSSGHDEFILNEIKIKKVYIVDWFKKSKANVWSIRGNGDPVLDEFKKRGYLKKFKGVILKIKRDLKI